jgi:F-type H+-transporting ATPase subunit epsilon
MAQSFHTSGFSLRVVVVTPEATAVDTLADFVALPLVDGEYGIAPRHRPMIGRLGYGELRIGGGDHPQRFYADGGFVQVAGNVVSVLTNRAVPAASLDTATAAEQLRTALARRAAGPEELAIRARLITQARGQLRVASRRDWRRASG